MARVGARNIQREAFWREQLQRQQASGTSVRQFCEAAGLSEASFYAWRRDAARATPAFLPVTIAPQLAGQEIILDLRGGRRLHWPVALPTTRLVELLLALEAGEDAR